MASGRPSLLLFVPSLDGMWPWVQHRGQLLELGGNQAFHCQQTEDEESQAAKEDINRYFQKRQWPNTPRLSGSGTGNPNWKLALHTTVQ